MLTRSWLRLVAGRWLHATIAVAVAGTSLIGAPQGGAVGGTTSPRAVIRGHVRDADGNPLGGIAVRALKARTIAGRLFLDSSAAPVLGSTTDKLGDYFLSVPPGRFAIASLARPAAGSVSDSTTTRAFPTCFFPASRTASGAEILELTAGAETVADFSLAANRVVTVSGSVAGADAVPGLAVDLERDEPGDVGTDLDGSQTITGPGGHFTFAGVHPGRYRLRVLQMPVSPGQPIMRFHQDGLSYSLSATGFTLNRPLPAVSDAPALWADQVIDVADDAKSLEDVSVWLQPGLRVSGRFVFEGAATRPSGDQLAVSIVVLVPVDARDRPTPPGRVNEDGTFSLPSVPPGRYSLLAVLMFVTQERPPAPRPMWSTRSIEASGRDVYGRVLNLTSDLSGVIVRMTDAPNGRLAGTVRAGDNTPGSDATIYIFPKDRLRWIDVVGLTSSEWFQALRPNAVTGAYEASLKPGVDYLVAAVTGTVGESWTDPDSLGALVAMATPIRLEAGQVRRLELTAQPR